MLTGDKVETATSIAISSGLKSRLNDLYFMREISSRDEIQDRVKYLNKFIKKTTLIIDGKTLDTIFQHQDLCE
jgi:magnesium-transporting ATPase (P-type)